MAGTSLACRLGSEDWMLVLLLLLLLLPLNARHTVHPFCSRLRAESNKRAKEAPECVRSQLGAADLEAAERHCSRSSTTK